MGFTGVKAIVKNITKKSSNYDLLGSPDLLKSTTNSRNYNATMGKTTTRDITKETNSSPTPEYKAEQQEKALRNNAEYDEKTGSIGEGKENPIVNTNNPNQAVKNNTSEPKGVETDTPTTKTDITEANTVKTTKSNSLGKVLGVTGLVGGAVGTYSLLSTLNKAESPISETENPNDGNNTQNGNTTTNPYGNTTTTNPYSNNGNPGYYGNGAEGEYGYYSDDVYGSGGGYYDDGYYQTAGEENGLGETINEIISAASNYAPYIIIGVAVLVGLYVLTKKGKKTGKSTKTSLKIGGVKSGRV